jgi:Glycosyl transferases group 1
MRVYVYQAYHPAGGTYMAYHVGRILHHYFGCEVFCVGERPADTLFDYPINLPAITEAEFLRQCAAEDLLICNPSFSAQQFGLRLPCRKLSYIQGIRTFAVLDVAFDHYVFVSEWARTFVATYYGIQGQVIPAFISNHFFAPKIDGGQRKPIFLMSQRKFEETHFQKLLQVYAAKFSGATFPYEVLPILPQAALAERFRGARYYLSLDAMEGFGLPMLEAMACGCAVAGWDSGGNREYARQGDNALLARYGDYESLANHIRALLGNDDTARFLAGSGALTAKRFDSAHFDLAWVRELSGFLQQPAVNFPQVP